MLNGLEGNTLGIWIAHGEGRITSDLDNLSYQELNNLNSIPLRYVDYNNVETTQYPLNPNGSLFGITGICSEDGRHLAMMPHPERCFLKWQLPWIQKEYQNKIKKYSPWFLMFKNAYNWCIKI